MELMDHQKEAIRHLGNGKILWGTVGSGKTATALAYYKDNESPRDIYVITTAKKRDSLDWEGEAASFGIGTESDATLHGVLTVDSWNNIGKYVDVEDAFFIFDEQRLVGTGAWVKAFLKIARKNRWIMLSATPGDTWLDYAPVFVANGHFKSIARFKWDHVMYEPYVKYPKIRMYLNERYLEELRNDILVEMPFIRETKRHINYLPVGHDSALYNKVVKERWNIFEDKPVKDAGELFRLLRKIVNTDSSRLDTILDLMKVHPRLIIFYNFNYELEILRSLDLVCPTYEWNGHRKDELPDSDNWVYLVQYVAGAEGWNCTSTDAMVLYSLPYSYKNFEQAQGRIDRLDTDFTDLYYYVLLTDSKIDSRIREALGEKRNFNERRFIKELGHFEADEPEFVECCQI
jgi:hypothetical protein